MFAINVSYQKGLNHTPGTLLNYSTALHNRLYIDFFFNEKCLTQLSVEKGAITDSVTPWKASFFRGEC